jgi:hypothetical protein
MKETTDYLGNILDILHAARKKNKKIGARLKHFYGSKEHMKVSLTGKGWVTVQTAFAVKGVKEMSKEEIMEVVESFEIK